MVLWLRNFVTQIERFLQASWVRERMRERSTSVRTERQRFFGLGTFVRDWEKEYWERVCSWLSIRIDLFFLLNWIIIIFNLLINYQGVKGSTPSNYKFLLLIFPTIALISKALLYSISFGSTFPKSAIIVIRVHTLIAFFLKSAIKWARVSF
jgi:hypothetical protein